MEKLKNYLECILKSYKNIFKKEKFHSFASSFDSQTKTSTFIGFRGFIFILELKDNFLDKNLIVNFIFGNKISNYNF
ncbi:hypothetical protein DLH72_01635 [Candidatus Gracilibacteria bacterium]|nr:MAG: hypothetical protein DLH72_01635 [Candidatus Gracilibacteria bacterium]